MAAPPEITPVFCDALEPDNYGLILRALIRFDGPELLVILIGCNILCAEAGFVRVLEFETMWNDMSMQHAAERAEKGRLSVQKGNRTGKGNLI